MIKIGPKNYMSDLPVGMVEDKAYEMIKAADEKRLRGISTYNFNIQLAKHRDGSVTAVRAYAINGSCRFKKYSIFDSAKYYVLRKLFKK